MKTNKKYYPYPEFGGYFKLKNNRLVGSPMLANGKRAIETFTVDSIEDKDLKRIEEIKKELQIKQ